MHDVFSGTTLRPHSSSFLWFILRILKGKVIPKRIYYGALVRVAAKMSLLPDALLQAVRDEPEDRAHQGGGLFRV